MILGNNKLTTLDCNILKGLANLESIELSNNRLRSIPTGFFDGLTSLRDVDLSHNLLHTIPSPTELGLIPNLQYVYLSNNNFSESAYVFPFFEKSQCCFVGGNPFLCDCGFQYLQDWFMNKSQSEKQMLGRFESLGCHFNDSYIDVTGDLPPEGCQMDDETAVTLSDSAIPSSTSHSRGRADSIYSTVASYSAHWSYLMGKAVVVSSSGNPLMKNIWAMSMANITICVLIIILISVMFCFIRKVGKEEQKPDGQLKPASKHTKIAERQNLA